ncbi:hypothetical protein FB559_0703 [Actinoallomurus bryophytorum]|uniref:Uncharacterized protein n=1 Tax=Actinoallomurus bryophytorum TaxID=1490222 RepID=A0A543CDN4_9ACTN|nr:hypothetical protein FB559_0703 [Actinoallomurus bryophytorum]
MCGLVHFITAADCRTFRLLLQPLLEHVLRTAAGRRHTGLAWHAIAAAGERA